MIITDPAVTNNSGREQISWGFSPTFAIQPGQTATQVYQAMSDPLDSGEYYNEVWAVFDELSYEVYTWPTSPVHAMGVVETNSTDGKTAVDSVVWLGSNSYIIGAWGLD